MIKSAALAADLVMGVIFEHLERNLTAKAARNINFSEFGCTSGQILNSYLERNLAIQALENHGQVGCQRSLPLGFLELWSSQPLARPP